MNERSLVEGISRFKKERFLLRLSEDDFRDLVVRPLFFRQGLTDGRDLCGPFEKGKDAVFVTVDKLGIEDAYVVQTKKGSINLSRRVHENLIEAITQLKTAAQTHVVFIKSKTKRLPTKVILCVSGKINEAARQHIVDAVCDPRLFFLDSDELIPKIDELFPELWLGIDADIAPYFRKLREIIESSDETLAIADLLPRDSQASVATDQGFVMLQLYRMTSKLQKQKGQIVNVPHMEQIPVTALLRKRIPLSVIFGGAGSGKSTSLKRLAFVLAGRGLKFDSAERPAVPVLVRAVHVLGNRELSLVGLCDAECKRLIGSAKASFSVDDLTAGKLVVLVDGLDEIPDEAGRVFVLSKILQFHSNYPDCKVVLTSRDYGSIQKLEELKKFAAYYLSPINYKQAQQIIRSLQRGKSLPPEKSDELVRRLEEVHGLELNPLLVTVFAATSEYSRQDIPANITELFKKFTEMMLGRWDATKGFKAQYHHPLKDFILQKVAFEMHRRGLTTTTVEEFDRILTTELGNRGHTADAAELRDEILNRSGLFAVVGDEVEFRHLMMQEFFAGRGISTTEHLHAAIMDPWWRRAVVFYFGDHAGESAALRSAIDATAGHSAAQKYNAALTLGLALQACYLVEVKDKIEIYQWVVDAISNADSEFIAASDPARRVPLSNFVVYYLVGRDSVALSVLRNRVQEILAKWSDSQLSQNDKDMRLFWTLVGLIECGAMEDVEHLLKRFKPSDPRLLLGVHLGSYLTTQVRLCTKDEKESAKRICDGLSGKVEGLRAQLLEEMKSELLEVRRGNIRSLAATVPADERPTLATEAPAVDQRG